MDLTGVNLKPAEGMLIVRFVDDDDDDDDDENQTPSYGADAYPESMPYEGCLAIVTAVGPKSGNVRVGNTIVTRPYARDGLKIGGGLTLIESYCVVATLAE